MPTRRSPGTSARATPTTATVDNQESTAGETEFDFDKRVVDQVDWSIWRALYNGEFRLAFKCRRCGRWLTDGRSKRAHLGPVCRAKAVGR